MTNMRVELISVGTEILLGNIVNTDAAFLSEECAKLGLACYYQSVVGDNAARLEETLLQALSRSEIVILTGGLGPTQDDITKEIACKVSGREMYLHEESRDAIRAFFEKRGIAFTDNNMKQAYIPVDSVVLKNNNGTAPGVIIPYNGKHIVLLPGPFNEMKPMFLESVVPYIRKLTSLTIFSKTVKIVSVPESKAEEMIEDIVEKQTNPTIATYAKTGEVHIRVTAAAESEEAAERLIKPVVRELKNRFGNNIYTTDENVSLEKSLVELLKAGELKCIIAEGGTNGLISYRMMSADDSQVVRAGLVTPTPKSKRRLLGVKKNSIEKYSIVSEQVAVEMVKSPEAWSKAEVILGVTDCELMEDSGMTRAYISCNTCGGITTKEMYFKGNAERVREALATQALVLMRQCVLEYISKRGL